MVGHSYAFTQVASAGAQPQALAHGSLFERLITVGRPGVFFFFALTGYLLYWPFAKRAFADGGAIDVRRYAMNRALRILPLYFAAIVIVTVLQHHGGTLSLWAHNLTLTQNFSHFTISKVDAPIWSVVVEVHFYVLLPFIALAIGWLAGGSLRRAAMIVGALGLAAFVVRSAVLQASVDPSGVWRLNLPGTFLFFIPGFLVALLRVRMERQLPGWAGGLLGRSDVWLGAAAVLLGLLVVMYSLQTIAIPLLSFFAIGACVLPLRVGRFTRSLAWRPLAAMGVASYSLYIWHVPIITAVRDNLGVHDYGAVAAIVIPLSIAAAFLSYVVIESPFLRLRRQWSAAAARHDADAPARAASEVVPEQAPA